MRTSIHDPAAMYHALCEAAALTSESQGRSRRCVPSDRPRPLRRSAAIPFPTEDRIVSRMSVLLLQV